MKHVHIVLLALILTACGKDKIVYVDNPVPVSAVTDDVQRVVDDENEYRLGIGQAALTKGLSCTVQEVASGDWISGASFGYPGSGLIALTGAAYTFPMGESFNQAETLNGGTHNILPASVRDLFATKNYRLSCSGLLVVTKSGYYSFELDSDDGSILTIDGAQVINNDGGHAMVRKTNVRYLREGMRSINLTYAKTSGTSFGLRLTSEGNPVPGNLFYR